MVFKSFKECQEYIKGDAFRYLGKEGGAFSLYFKVPGFKYTVWLRLCSYLCGRRSLLPLYAYAKYKHKKLSIKYGIQIPFGTVIGKGFYMGHYGGIVVNGNAIIGNNVNLSQGVTIGMSNRGERAGYPILRDNIYIGPGAKIVGRVVISSGVAIGANAVVTKDIPENAVVVGIPARVISFNGADKYVERTV